MIRSIYVIIYMFLYKDIYNFISNYARIILDFFFEYYCIFDIFALFDMEL